MKRQCKEKKRRKKREKREKRKRKKVFRLLCYSHLALSPWVCSSAISRASFSLLTAAASQTPSCDTHRRQHGRCARRAARHGAEHGVAKKKARRRKRRYGGRPAFSPLSFSLASSRPLPAAAAASLHVMLLGSLTLRRWRRCRTSPCSPTQRS